MNYNVFISHNINEENTKIIQTLEAHIPNYINLYVAEHDLDPGSNLTDEIENEISPQVCFNHTCLFYPCFYLYCLPLPQ